MLKLRSKDLEFREIEGEVVALDLKSTSYIGINQSGGTLWAMLKEGTDQNAMAERLMETFGVSESIAQQDVSAFVDELRKRGLLTETP